MEVGPSWDFGWRAGLGFEDSVYMSFVFCFFDWGLGFGIGRRGRKNMRLAALVGKTSGKGKVLR